AATGYLPEEIAPGLGEVGVVLPYSPLHHLLLEEFGRPVVATSGNPSGEPLVISIPDARALLGDFCDGFLLHDRDIVVPVEDSVFM
ncbi:carbamoyltransferase HypF, partial [Bacteroides thetaiotaomicron]|uniref:Sua5/YciO/YrdC/YwlC family protein n=1 Tax=Bacteroides thetaiotaomicron TaxID=818 RepID=UPI00192740A8